MEPKQRSKTVAVLVVAAAVVVVALVAALVLSVVTGGDESEGGTINSAPEASAPVSGPDAAPTTDGDEAFAADPLGRPVTVVESTGGTPREQAGEPGGFPTGQGMVGAPDGLELQRVRSGVTVAVSTSDGPTTVEGDVMTGYAHSARGAGLLGMNLVGLNMSTSVATKEFLTHFAPADQRQETEDMPGYSDAAEDANREYLVRGYVAPRHVRFLTCEPDFCTVEVATPSLAEAVGQVDAGEIDPNTHLISRVSMHWADDQWVLISTMSRQDRELDSTWERWS